MPVEVAIFLSSSAAKLFKLLLQCKIESDNNEIVGREVNLFIKSLDENVTYVTKMLPDKSSPWALESLKGDLDEAEMFLENCLQKGFIKKLWNAKDTGVELARRRQRLVDAFQTKLIITSLEYHIHGNKKTENFQSKMLQLVSHNSATLRSDLKALLQPVVMELTPTQVDGVQSFIATYRGFESDHNPERSTETEKFLADIFANLEELTQESLTTASTTDHDSFFHDPITFELMCDPVKCSDGRTYDRWTVIENNSYQVPSLKIACDDVSVRGRLFEKFPEAGLEKKYHKMRKEYRETTLSLANKGHDAEALTRLKHVLEWNEQDTECLQMCEQIKQRLSSVVDPPPTSLLSSGTRTEVLVTVPPPTALEFSKSRSTDAAVDSELRYPWFGRELCDIDCQCCCMASLLAVLIVTGGPCVCHACLIKPPDEKRPLFPKYGGQSWFT